MPTREERIAGGLYGLLIGDALGVPYEFHLPEHLPPREQIEFQPPAGFHRAHSGVPPGTWSDDGAHALCLLASLLYRKTLDIEDLGRRLAVSHTVARLETRVIISDRVIAAQAVARFVAVVGSHRPALAVPRRAKDDLDALELNRLARQAHGQPVRPPQDDRPGQPRQGLAVRGTYPARLG